MSNTETNIRGIYRWDYGYSGHTTYFVSTREEVKKCEGGDIEIETSKHSMETVGTDVKLITEDQDFIDKFLEYKLQGDSPLDHMYDEDEDSDLEE